MNSGDIHDESAIVQNLNIYNLLSLLLKEVASFSDKIKKLFFSFSAKAKKTWKAKRKQINMLSSVRCTL